MHFFQHLTMAIKRHPDDGNTSVLLFSVRASILLYENGKDNVFLWRPSTKRQRWQFTVFETFGFGYFPQIISIVSAKQIFLIQR